MYVVCLFSWCWSIVRVKITGCELSCLLEVRWKTTKKRFVMRCRGLVRDTCLDLKLESLWSIYIVDVVLFSCEPVAGLVPLIMRCGAREVTIFFRWTFVSSFKRYCQYSHELCKWNCCRLPISFVDQRVEVCKSDHFALVDWLICMYRQRDITQRCGEWKRVFLDWKMECITTVILFCLLF